VADVAFPFHFDGHGRTAAPTYAGHVRDMIELLLFTSPGERVNRPDFGSGLLAMVFSPNSPEVAGALQFSAQAALQRWLGDVIQIEALSVTAEDAKLEVELTYTLLQTGEQRTDSFQRGAP
jgi:phage baseplate assembly protein W